MTDTADAAWELTYQEGTSPMLRSVSSREHCITELVGRLLDAGVTVPDDPTAIARAAGGNVKAEFTAPDGTVIHYTLRELKPRNEYLSLAQFAERIGVAPNSLGRYKLPDPDATIGPVNDDGTIPRGTIRGWWPETIDEWNANRPGRGTRTDLAE